MAGSPGRRLDPRALFSMAAAASWLAVTAFETLRPIGWIQHIPFWAFFTETMASVDLVQNLVLFAPAGWIARRAGWTARRSLLAAFVVSALIEFLQQWVPGRTSTAMDIACNTTGAALGWWMATPAVRPRVRLGVVFVALAAFMGLHVLNTDWSNLVEDVGGSGVWATVDRHICAPPAREGSVCITVPNTARRGNKFVMLAGPPGRAYARVKSAAFGRLMGRGDCVRMDFEWTIGAQMRLRPPIVNACALVQPTDSVIELRVNPRLEHEQVGPWTPTHAGVWMWPVWPFQEYRPGLLRALGAATFVAGAALVIGEAVWVLPIGYLLVLLAASVMTGLRGPGWWDLGWAAVGWLVASALVAADRWWRRSNTEPPGPPLR